MKGILGIDIGSAASAVVVLNDRKQPVFKSYRFHTGQVAETLIAQLQDVDLIQIKNIAYTSSCPAIFRSGQRYDNRVAAIKAARYYYPEMRGLLLIGAEKFGLASFNADGSYRNYRSNTSCAAGTGSFLDQQLSRLNLNSISRLGELAASNRGDFPKIASRCSVFAKTDLIHAQQEGYSLSVICDGLCYGLAKNVVDTVFEEAIDGKLVLAGGVALNDGVVRHLRQILNSEIEVGKDPHFYGAIGAALMMQEEGNAENSEFRFLEDIILKPEKTKQFYNTPLELKLSDYPDFSSLEDYRFFSSRHPEMGAVEISKYEELPSGKQTRVFLGIDIGSTSTKAVIIDSRKKVLAGFYTRTSGRPVAAVQCLFEAIDNLAEKNRHVFRIAGAGTTGSGRKLIGKITGADLIPDEITAHARAAVDLDPQVDTIIEIGGQDSKFTLLKDGRVTFSIMNNVCAAGTGSFIEEQAHKLNCPLEDFADRAEKASSPMSSDRCTVFMERDLNHYLNEGYDTNELLASVLHSIRDNYLSKVTGKARIGERIFFQGATAKNKALVAAFEQKLQKPIMVSKFCHLTGALGVALSVMDRNLKRTSFRGLHLWKREIPVKTEICSLCTNHCKLRIAAVNGETVAYGFLCGRDYETEKYVKNEKEAFDFTGQYRKIFSYRPKTKESALVIGIPPALHIFEEMPVWQAFFDLLGIRTINSENYTNSVKEGKKTADAEFCAPISSAFGHVHYLYDKADYIFLPVYLEEGSEISASKQYCYYTQYISAMLASTRTFRNSGKLLMPLVKSLKPESKTIDALQNMMNSIGFGHFSRKEIAGAYKESVKYHDNSFQEWRNIYLDNHDPEQMEIILLGRPYTLLSSAMNSNIPHIIAGNGYSVYHMDMLADEGPENEAYEKLVRTMTWKYASTIIKKAGLVGRSDNLYPVLVTSFKCTPDSFVIEYFREIMESHEKPYLILQLDEHNSGVGYETRIEAAIQSFKNHFYRKRKTGSPKIEIPGIHVPTQPELQDVPEEVQDILRDHQIDPSGYTDPHTKPDQVYDLSGLKTGETDKLRDKTLLLPGWDLQGSKLLEAVLKAEGQDTIMIPDTDDSIRRSLKINTGQCLPLSTIVQNCCEYITEHALDPSLTAIWIPRGFVACNLTMFPHYMKKLLRRYDERMAQVSIYPGKIAFYDFSVKTGVNAYLAFLFAGSIKKVACRIRPYEKTKGATNKVVDQAIELLYRSFLEQSSKEPVIRKIMEMFDTIEKFPGNRPKVAVFGDIYVRDNDIFNQNLVNVIEENGGEALLTSLSEYLKIVLKQNERRLFREGRYLEHYNLRLLKNLIPMMEIKYNRYFSKYIHDIRPLNGQINDILDKHHLQDMHRGESIENILKIENLIRHYHDISLFVQTSPAYCCPSLVTEAMASRIEDLTGIPVVSIEYDGTKGFKNEAVIPYLLCR